MKRILLSVVAAGALAFCGLFTSTAQAHGPHGHGHGNHCYPSYGYRYGGYVPYNVYRPAYTPYGAGYVGGWQPYQGFYYQQPRFGLYVGF